MSIRITMQRDDWKPDELEKSAQEALERLVVYEVGYGGRFEIVEETKIKINTTLLGCRDQTTFEGTAEEMFWLYQMSLIACMINDELCKSEVAQKNLANRLHRFSEGNPFLVIHGAGIMAGAGTVRAMCISVLVENNVELVERFKKLSREDLYALLELKLFEGCTQSEILDLAA